MTCHRFPPLPRPPVRRAIGAGASIGPIRRIAVPCALGLSVVGGVVAARPPAVPDWIKPAPAAFVAPHEPVPIPAPGGLVLLGLGVAVLWGVRKPSRGGIRGNKETEDAV